MTVHRAGPPPLPDRRAGARARRPVRRRDRAVGARARRHPARRPRGGGHRRRRGQPADLPGRQGEVPLRADHRPLSTTRGTSTHFKLLGIQPAVSATDLILRLIEHEVPRYGLVHLLDLPEERLEIIELVVADDAPAAGKRVADIGAARGRAGHLGAARRRAASSPRPTPWSRPGDEVLVVLDPGLEEDITGWFVGQRRGVADRARRRPDRRRRRGGRRVRRGAARRAASTARSCSSAASPTRRTSARRPPRTTCAARSAREDVPAPRRRLVGRARRSSCSRARA